MHAAIVTYGSRGDVEPFVALACGLRQRGHTVTLACPAALRGLADAHDVHVVPLPGDPGRLVRGLVREAGHSLPRMIRSVSRFVLPVAADVFRALLDGIPRADVVIHSFLMTQAGNALATRCGAVQASAQLFPVFAPTRAWPAPAFPDLPLGAAYRWCSHRITTEIFRSGGNLLYRRVRALDPDLPPYPGWPFDASEPAGIPLLMMAFSPTLVPRPADWPPHVNITGFWSLPQRAWQPEPGLLSFLDAGSPPIYVGFGSSSPEDPGLGSRLLEAIARLGVRALLDAGGGGTWPHDLPAGCCLIDGVPHAWLLPRVTLAVHHGGAGTTGAVLRAGIPSVVLPFTADQPFWARRLARLGAAPAPLSPRRASAQALASALHTGLTDAAMRGRAERAGKALRREDGVALAASLLEAHVARHVHRT